MCNYFIYDGSVSKPRKKEFRIFQKWQALPETLHTSIFLQAARLPLSKSSAPTSKNCLRDSLLDTLSCQNDPTEVIAHFQKPSEGAVTGHASVFRYTCLMAVLEQRDSVLVCSTPGIVLTDGALGCSSKAGTININDFLPLPHSVVPGGQHPQPGCF